MYLHKMDFTLVKLAALLTIFSYSQICCADNFESTEQLQQLAKDFAIQSTAAEADETVNVVVSPLSVQLPKCSSPVQPSLPANSNHDQITGIELTCNGSTSWQTLVPINVEVYAKVIVAKQMILPKQTVTENDVDIATFDKNHLYAGYFKNKDEIIGQVASHLLTPGSVFTKKSLQAPIIIHKNQVVSITARNSVVSVTMQGIAQSDGALNEAIRVYNPSTKRVVDAVVVGASKAEIV